MISQTLLLPNVSAICCSPILAFLIISFYNFIFLFSLNNIQVCYIESAMNLHPFFNFFIRSFILALIVPISSRLIYILIWSSVFWEQKKHTVSGSDLPYHFVGAPPHSTSPIAWAEHLLLLL